MINTKAGKIISIFSIIYGTMTVISNVLENDFTGDRLNIFVMVISVGLIVTGIMSIKRINKDVQIKGLVIIMSVHYFLMAALYILVLVISVIGIIMLLIELGVLMVPVISGFKYLSSLKKHQQKLKELNNDSVFTDEFDIIQKKTAEEKNI